MYGNRQHPPCQTPGQFKRILRIVLSKDLWKRVLFCTVYFAASLIILNDLFLMLVRTFVPDSFPGARVVVLETLLQSLTKILGAGV